MLPTPSPKYPAFLPAIPFVRLTVRAQPEAIRSLSICSSTISPTATATANHLDPSRVSRRDFVLLSAMSAAALVLEPAPAAAQTDADLAIFTLPDLPYAYDSLQPYISEQIMHAHHDAHFATYIKNLNKALAKLADPLITNDASLRKLMAQLDGVTDKDLRTLIRNNAGGYLNHKHFFATMTPGGSALSQGTRTGLAAAIDRQYGSFDAFADNFLQTATGLFGSGFVWLVKDGNGKLRITKYPNQDNPALDGESATPLLGCDCWEHAWYYQYGPKKADYIKAWWKVVDWQAVSKFYDGKV